MWEKAAYLAFFAELCLAQRGAIANLNARQAEVLILRNPQYDTLPPNVFTTVLFPSVPTEAPTGVMVPTVITYTGTFDAVGGVPSGYQPVPVTVNNGQTLAESPTAQQPTQTQQPIPTQEPTPIQQPTQKPTDLPTQRPTVPLTLSHTPDISKPAPSRSADPNSRPGPSQSHSQLPHPSSVDPSHSAPHFTSSHTTLITSSRPLTSSSSSAAPSGTGVNPNNNGANNSGPDANPHLSAGAIGGIVAGVVGGIGALAALLLLLLNKNKNKKAPDSPIYPTEAYLYDPPITPPDGSRPGGPAGFDAARAGTPEMTANENTGLMAGAGAGAAGAMAAGAIARNRRDGYAPVELGETQPANPFDDPAHEYRRSADPTVWPLNPAAPSGLGTPPGTSAGPSGTQTPPGGPQIAGVGSQRYDRRISMGPNGSTGNLAPPGSYNPAMREARRAWGMDQ